MDDGLLGDKILEVVANTPAKITPLILKKTILQQYGFDQKQINSMIRELVAVGDLVYTYEHGCTFLEISFNRPLRISEHVVLKPPEHHYQPQTGDVVVNVKPGASFGAGRHPTTRLAIRGLDYALGPSAALPGELKESVLDIGTGSGVLVMTAVLLGVACGLGLDIDACALAEASANAEINHLSARIEISNRSIEDIKEQFSVIVANLRYPSLKQLIKILRKICQPGGMLILSGIQSHECANLIDSYGSAGFENIWMADELDWAGMVFKYTDPGVLS